MAFKVMKHTFTGDISVCILTDGKSYIGTYFGDSSIEQINSKLETYVEYSDKEACGKRVNGDWVKGKPHTPKGTTLAKAEKRYKEILQAAMGARISFKTLAV